jgi:hypothetical protein
LNITFFLKLKKPSTLDYMLFFNFFCFLLTLEGFLAKLTKKNFSQEKIFIFGRDWMLKQGSLKKLQLSNKYFFSKFFLILLLLEGCLTKLTRKNFFSTNRVVFRSKMMVKISKNGQNWLFVEFFLHICNLQQKLYIITKFQKNRIRMHKTRVYRWGHLKIIFFYNNFSNFYTKTREKTLSSMFCKASFK